MGCAVLGIGIYALVDGADLVDIVESADADVSLKVFTSAAIILIVVSVFVVILTFFGCCGAIKESKCMLGTYFTLILAMFVVMIVGAVIGYSQSMDEVRGAVEKSMKKFKDDVDADGVSKEEKAITNAWNTLQGDVSYLYHFWDIIQLHNKNHFLLTENNFSFSCSLHAVVHFSMEQVMLETVGQQLTVLHTQSLWMEKHTKCQPHVVIVSKTIQTTQLKIVGWTPILLTVIYQKMKS